MRFVLFILALITLPASAGVVPAQNQQQSMPKDKQKAVEMDRTMMAMSSRHMDMGPHMRMSQMRPAGPGDQQRADDIVRKARAAIEKYKDYKVALQDSYHIFLPQVPQNMYHFNNDWYGMEANYRFNPEHPTSLLYESA